MHIYGTTVTEKGIEKYNECIVITKFWVIPKKESHFFQNKNQKIK